MVYEILASSVDKVVDTLDAQSDYLQLAPWVMLIGGGIAWFFKSAVPRIMEALPFFFLSADKRAERQTKKEDEMLRRTIEERDNARAAYEQEFTERAELLGDHRFCLAQLAQNQVAIEQLESKVAALESASWVRN